MSEVLNNNINTLSGRSVWLDTSGAIQDISAIKEIPQKRRYLELLANRFYKDEYQQHSSLPYNERFIQNKSELFAAYITEKVDLGKVTSLSYKDGILRLFDIHKQELYSTNAVRLWDTILKGNKEVEGIEKNLKVRTEKLREEAMTDSLFGGAILVKYTTTGATVGLLADSTLSATQRTLNGGDILTNRIGKSVTIKELFVRNSSGQMEKILLGDKMIGSLKSLTEGPRELVRQNSLRILQTLGYFFDPVKRACTHVTKMAFLETVRTLKSIPLKELRSKYGVIASEEDFSRMLDDINRVKSLVAESGYTPASITKSISGKLMHAIMFPVFFSSFTKHQNSANLMAGFAEWGLFTAGAMVGSRVGGFFGVSGKILAPLILGGGAAIGGHYLWEKYDGNQKKWKMFNGLDMYSHKRSAILHGLNFGVPEVLDQINKNRDESIDIGTSSFNLGKNLPEGWGKHIPLTGGTGVFPEITFVQSRVNLGVDPDEWMGSSVNNRNINQWNTEVARYKEELLMNIFKLISSYQRNESPFSQKNTKEKNMELFGTILAVHVLNINGSDRWKAEQMQIHSAIMSILPIWDSNKSPMYCRDIVENYISGMLLDKTTFLNEPIRASLEHENIEQKIEILAQSIPHTKEKKYFLSLFERIKSHKPLFEPDTLKIDPITAEAIPVFSEEHKLFLSILDNQTLITFGSDNMTRDGEQMSNIKIGKVFASLLDMMSNYIIKKDSMERLSKINSNERGAYWAELEGIGRMRR